MRQEIILGKGKAGLATIVKFLTALPLDKAYRVEVSEYRPRRTDQQNRYLFGVVYPTILEAGGEALGGWTAADLHEHFLGEHFGLESLSFGGRAYEKPIRRSSRLNKQEFSDYVAFVQRQAAGLGIYVPEPDVT